MLSFINRAEFNSSSDAAPYRSFMTTVLSHLLQSRPLSPSLYPIIGLFFPYSLHKYATLNEINQQMSHSGDDSSLPESLLDKFRTNYIEHEPSYYAGCEIHLLLVAKLIDSSFITSVSKPSESSITMEQFYGLLKVLRMVFVLFLYFLIH